MTLYHGTATANISSILSDGLLPHVPEKYNWRPCGVFLYTEPGMSYVFGGAVFAVEVSGLLCLERDGKERVYEGPIAPDRIRLLEAL